MTTIINQTLLDAHVADFLSNYVEKEKKENARKALAKVCNLYALVTMKKTSEGMLNDVAGKEIIP